MQHYPADPADYPLHPPHSMPQSACGCRSRLPARCWHWRSQMPSSNHENRQRQNINCKIMRRCTESRARPAHHRARCPTLQSNARCNWCSTKPPTNCAHLRRARTPLHSANIEPESVSLEALERERKI